jgi:acetyltransferase-like isoleucine patch superfamily enzyme
LQLILTELAEWINECISRAPGRTGMLVRRWAMQARLRGLGFGASFEPGTIVDGASNVEIGSQFHLMRNSSLRAADGKLIIGSRVSVNCNVQINASDGGINTIGDDCLIRPNVVLRASNHVYESLETPVAWQGHRGGFIVIEDDVWIGSNVVVVPNVRVGAHAIVAAGAVVTRDVGNACVLAGVPARVIKRRNL